MKGNIKVLIGIVIGIIVSSSCIVVAKTIFTSDKVSYSNTVSGGSYDNVKETLDELYQRAGYQKDIYTEKILNGADPVLGEGMIPVYIDGDGNVYYANTHTSWYSYEYKRWANAVILVDDAYDKYHTGDLILEEDIESYFVWIPRYAYKIWNLGNYNSVIEGSTLDDSDYEHSISTASNNAKIIEVEFGTKSYLDNKSYKSLTRDANTGAFSDPIGIAVDNYLQHPGFTLGEKELNGIWVGKFETTGNTYNITVKPSQTSWKDGSVSTMFNTAYNYNTALNSHMMKNTEWGAVAYLSHSAYGKGAQVNINNARDFKTGYSASPNTDQSTYQGTYESSRDSTKTQPWNTATGYLASTTGNITGVYDMAGGAWEYVAATMINNGQKIAGDASGFNSSDITTYMKLGYIDAYPADSNITSYNKRILGDATGEMGPFYSYFDSDVKWYHNSWYADGSHFVYSTYPWFRRGGHFFDGVRAGQFDFNEHTGSPAGCGSRLVLTGTSRTVQLPE